MTHVWAVAGFVFASTLAGCTEMSVAPLARQDAARLDDAASSHPDAAPVLDAARADAFSLDASARDAQAADATFPDATPVADAAMMSMDAQPQDAGNMAPDAAVDPCREIAAEYERLTSPAMMMCGGARQCHLLNGHCGVGLGGCYYALNTGVSQADLDALARQWSAASCRGSVCRCAPRPTSVRCDSGGCLAR